MVDHHITVAASTESVSLMMRHLPVAKTETHETHNHIVGLNEKGIVGYTDSIAGSCLTGNGDIGIFKPQLRF